jgi:hypothetical protein
MCQKIEAHDLFKNMAAKIYGLELLRAINDITHNFESQNKLSQAFLEAKQQFCTPLQRKQVRTQAYIEQYRNIVDILKHSGAMLDWSPD